MSYPTDQPELSAEDVEDRGQSATDSPLVFISHDSRDGTLAKAFANLLIDASGGFLKSFRSGEGEGTTGIEFGTEWYQTIMEKLNDATNVIALLTPHSINRPWILYESGVAKGKLNTNVFGLAIGIPLDQIATGPFAQFQNCSDDEDSLTGLILRLVCQHPKAIPRNEAIRLQVKEFLKTINTVQTNSSRVGTDDQEIELARRRGWELQKTIFGSQDMVDEDILLEEYFDSKKLLQIKRDSGKLLVLPHPERADEFVYPRWQFDSKISKYMPELLEMLEPLTPWAKWRFFYHSNPILLELTPLESLGIGNIERLSSAKNRISLIVENQGSAINAVRKAAEDYMKGSD